MVPTTNLFKRLPSVGQGINPACCHSPQKHGCGSPCTTADGDFFSCSRQPDTGQGSPCRCLLSRDALTTCVSTYVDCHHVPVPLGSRESPPGDVVNPLEDVTGQSNTVLPSSQWSDSGTCRHGKVKTRRPKEQENVCAVCGDKANGNFFSATVCLPCKSFFIRCTKVEETVIHKVCQGACEVRKTLRHRCQYCRYQRCLAIGMKRKDKPEKVVAAEGQELCRVCGDLANGIHFGVFTCEGCKKFFRRGQSEHASYMCRSDKECSLNPRNRNHCRRCRYRKCLGVGMSRGAIKMGRPRKFHPRRATKGKAGASAAAHYVFNGNTTANKCTEVKLTQPLQHHSQEGSCSLDSLHHQRNDLLPQRGPKNEHCPPLIPNSRRSQVENEPKEELEKVSGDAAEPLTTAVPSTGNHQILDGSTTQPVPVNLLSTPQKTDKFDAGASSSVSGHIKAGPLHKDMPAMSPNFVVDSQISDNNSVPKDVMHSDAEHWQFNQLQLVQPTSISTAEHHHQTYAQTGPWVYPSTPLPRKNKSRYNNCSFSPSSDSSVFKGSLSHVASHINSEILAQRFSVTSCGLSSVPDMHRQMPKPPNMHRQVSDPPNMHRQMPKPPNMHRQVSDPPNMHRQVSDPPNMHGQVSYPPNMHGQVSDPPNMHGQVSDPPNMHGQMPQPPNMHRQVSDPPNMHRQVSDPPNMHRQVSDPRTIHRQMPQPPTITIHRQVSDPPTIHRQVSDPPTIHRQMPQPPTIHRQGLQLPVIHRQGPELATMHRQVPKPPTTHHKKGPELQSTHRQGPELPNMRRQGPELPTMHRQGPELPTLYILQEQGLTTRNSNRLVSCCSNHNRGSIAPGKIEHLQETVFNKREATMGVCWRKITSNIPCCIKTNSANENRDIALDLCLNKNWSTSADNNLARIDRNALTGPSTSLNARPAGGISDTRFAQCRTDETIHSRTGSVEDAMVNEIAEDLTMKKPLDLSCPKMTTVLAHARKNEGHAQIGISCCPRHRAEEHTLMNTLRSEIKTKILTNQASYPAAELSRCLLSPHALDTSQVQNCPQTGISSGSRPNCSRCTPQAFFRPRTCQFSVQFSPETNCRHVLKLGTQSERSCPKRQAPFETPNLRWEIIDHAYPGLHNEHMDKHSKLVLPLSTLKELVEHAGPKDIPRNSLFHENYDSDRNYAILNEIRIVNI